MGILSNTVSICHFRVQGELAEFAELYDIATDLLTRQGFRPIDDSTEELSIGWVTLDDTKKATFDSTSWRDRYLCFSLRRDQRKVPAALLKEHVEKACSKWLEDNDNFTRVPKLKKDEIKEVVRQKLLAKTLPDPKVYDVVWDTETGILTFTTLSKSTIELLEDLFKKTFEGLRLTAFHPYERAMMVTPDCQALAALNKATTDNYLELIKENAWIGTDFMAWLLYQTLNGDSEYRVCGPGPERGGTPFTAYIDDKVVLAGASDNGTQVITVNGPQDRFSEVKSAMLGRKQIGEATIHMEAGGEKYCLTLKGEMFHFASFSTPAVKIEKDNTADEQLEREAVFFERMALLEKGLQLFNSLFATFLGVRLYSWGEAEAAITGWLDAA